MGDEFFLNGFDPIKEIPNGVYLTGFFSNTPTQKIVNEMIGFIDRYKIQPKIGATFKFEEIQKAIAFQDSGKADGKIVVTV